MDRAGMDIEIGSHLYRNTDGTVEIEGIPQIILGLKKPEGPLLVNFVAYDDAGRITVKVVGSALAFNERRAYDLTRVPTSVTLKHVESGKVALQVELKGDGRVAIRKGEMLTVKGHLLEITPTEWKVEKTRVAGGESDCQGAPITIG